LSADEVSEIVEAVHVPVLAELAQRRTPFLGTLYAGLMLTEHGPRVLEFNCRFGDPETQVVLPLVDGDLLEGLAAAAAGDVRGVEVASSGRSAVAVVLAGRDYPARGDAGTPIEGIETAERAGALVLHAATALHDGQLVTNGGRILNVVAVADSVPAARAAAYDAVAHIDFAGMRYRTDIARLA
jgi:phosphoribosylamine---glycine ligase